MALYPLFADLEGREVLVVGGGEVAARKVAALLKAGAQVRLHAHEVPHPELADALAAGRIARLGGDFDPAWLDAVWLVVAATDDTAFNAGLAAEAGRRRRLVNVVDDAALSSFQVPAVVERAPLVVAISSGGAAPMLARRVRERLETLLDPSLGVLAALFGEYRDRIRARLPDLAARRRWFERVLDGRMERAFEGGGAAAVEAAFAQEVARAAEPQAAAGAVALVAVGDAPDLYTLRALRALNEADAIVLVEGVDPALLEPARRDAPRIRADAAAAVRRALELAGDGARVVFLHRLPCDAGARGRLAEACAQAGIACRSVPAAA
ncbi:NAD(P)-dependent oxidoreductase [Pseudoxanthomonas suwonensis]|uniref:precorrin-2 dehydrogenase n=1 Tax=Pseudoxanthomonas suwonensis TaxID=314722 RepID=A0A0E3UN28_9GAMM|nr:NAD(P)-dependent oxidoreductase [Pseudoxanthomonas suwonensis]AKC86836.1 siroheme synthase [Pseudoxanthomonas suwonensis]